MANEFSTAGITLKYAFEETAGTKPNSGYVTVPGIKSMPEINPEPSSLECTDLSDLIWKRYIPGLRDPGSSIGFTANLTSEFKSAWNTLVTTSQTKKSAGLATWFEIFIPDLDSFYFKGDPVALGFGGAEVDAVLETTAYVVPNGISGFAAHSS